MSRIELLAPAGDLERLKVAVRYGADAVYLGGKQFSLRTRASNFTLDDIQAGVAFAHGHDARVHVTVNMIPHEEDFNGLEAYLKALESIGVDAIIVASYAIMKLAKQVAPSLEVHVSTQHSSTNSAAIAFWAKEGMDRVVLAREYTMAQIQETCKHSSLPVEVFVHGGMCIAYSGRCMLSNYMTGRDANRGGCAQSCRWNYRLYDDHEAVYSDKEMFSMGSKDLCAIDYIPALVDAGVRSLKIEGRMKSQYYLATIVRAYRMCIDAYCAYGYIPKETMRLGKEELAKAENRESSIGFYGGSPQSDGHLYGGNGLKANQDYLAEVVDYDAKTKIATLRVRNNFSSNMACEAFGPHLENTRFTMPTLYDEEEKIVEVANKPMAILHAKIEIDLHAYDMIRKIRG